MYIWIRCGIYRDIMENVGYNYVWRDIEMDSMKLLTKIDMITDCFY